MRTILKLLTVVLWFATLWTAILWYLHPENNRYEPITVMLGLAAAAISSILAWKPTASLFSKRSEQAQQRRISAIPLGPDHRSVLSALNAADVEYLVFGGFASLVYGKVSITHDLDIWVGYHLQNHSHLISALSSFGIGLSISTISQHEQSGVSLRLGTTPIDLCFKHNMGDQDFYTFYARRNTKLINGVNVTLISQQDNRQQTSYRFS